MLFSSSVVADLEKIERDHVYLMTCFREVLEAIGEATLAGHLPWRAAGAPPSEPVDPVKLAQAYSISFQLLNVVEENAVIQYRRALEQQGQTLCGRTERAGDRDHVAHARAVAPHRLTPFEVAERRHGDREGG